MEKIHFPRKNKFDLELKNRIEKYFIDNNIKQTGNLFLYFKALFSLIGIIVFYYLLVFQTETVLFGFINTFFLVQFMVLLAFNVMHDGGHQSFSTKKTINNIAVWIMELLGSSSMLWKQKHNTLHHTYTNVAGKDDDINLGSLLRLSPAQEYKSWHKYQYLYAPFLYSFLSLYLLFYSDFQRFITGKIGTTPLQRHGKKDLIFFLGGKLLYLSYALILPMFFHNPLVVIGFFIFAHLIFGLTLSIVFQLAHTVSETDFPIPNNEGEMPMSWAEHQLHTTANFAMQNSFVTFYCGGLNHQVEHHLFQKISHIHYSNISKIVQETCKEFNKPYLSSQSFTQALVSHFKFLKKMGTQS